MKYTKTPIDVPAQIDLLIERGLSIPDTDKASHYLNNISYFRLSAYMHFFQLNDGKHSFKKGTTLDDITDLYSFDRELRLLVFDAIERIEVAIRAQIINQLSVAHGANWYEKKELFWHDTKFNHANFLVKIEEDIKGGTEQFIKHYSATYTDPKNPPSWMLFEILSMSTLSFLYAALNTGEQKTNVSSHFKIPDNIFISWFHSLCFVRNICAHHGRLWNRFFTIRPLLPTRKKYQFLENIDLDTRKLYLILCCIQHLLNTINPTSSFKTRLKDLLKKHPNVPVSEMGFPDKWDTENIWS